MTFGKEIKGWVRKWENRKEVGWRHSSRGFSTSKLGETGTQDSGSSGHQAVSACFPVAGGRGSPWGGEHPGTFVTRHLRCEPRVLLLPQSTAASKQTAVKGTAEGSCLTFQILVAQWQPSCYLQGRMRRAIREWEKHAGLQPESVGISNSLSERKTCQGDFQSSDTLAEIPSL